MKKQVAKSVLNVVVEQPAVKVTSKTGDDDEEFPNEDEIGQKYDLSISDPESPGARQFHKQIQDNSHFVNRTEALIAKLDEKNMELDRLCTLMEALEPIPGIDVERLKRHLDGSIDNDPIVDYRDAKIVALAKKVRGLTVLLNKARATVESKNLYADELGRKCERLEQELRNALVAKAGGSGKGFGDGDSAAAVARLQKELASATKEMTEMRRRELKLNEEVRSMNRALANELGEGVTVEQSQAEGGWRGRAQQIIMLKAKVKKLEAALAQGDQLGSNSSAVPSSSASRAISRRNDVDAKADAEIANMVNDRKQAIEMITEDRDRLLHENQQLEAKARARKSRIQILEADTHRLREQLRVVIDKSSSDDSLIDSLKAEVEKMKQQIKERGSAAAAAAGALVISRPNQQQKGGLEPVQMQELQRLRRLCEQQAQQLETQDDVIRQLRGAAGGGGAKRK